MTRVNPASTSTKGLAARAAPRSPEASAVAAVVIPHSGHGIPVRVRNGQGSHSPSPPSAAW
jgi:hypothetical protein